MNPGSSQFVSSSCTCSAFQKGPFFFFSVWKQKNLLMLYFFKIFTLLFFNTLFSSPTPFYRRLTGCPFHFHHAFWAVIPFYISECIKPQRKKKYWSICVDGSLDHVDEFLWIFSTVLVKVSDSCKTRYGRVNLKILYFDMLKCGINYCHKVRLCSIHKAGFQAQLSHTVQKIISVCCYYTRCNVLIANYFTIVFHYSLQLAFPWWSPCNPALWWPFISINSKDVGRCSYATLSYANRLAPFTWLTAFLHHCETLSARKTS